MRIVRRSVFGGSVGRDPWGIQAVGRKFQHGLNLFSSHMELLNNFLDARTRLKIFKHGRDRHSRAAEYQAPLRLPGMLSTTGQRDQSSVGMLHLP
jgi:hypothetical protein